MTGPPERSEASPYYFTYIDLIPSQNVIDVLEFQMEEALALWRRIPEAKSLYRYAPEKWSIREVLNHINDVERMVVHRAFWFARGFETALPGFDQDVAVDAGRADEFSWASHVEEFRTIRPSTITFFKNLPFGAWTRTGIASENAFSVRALAYIVAGHLLHHTRLIQERYL